MDSLDLLLKKYTNPKQQLSDAEENTVLKSLLAHNHKQEFITKWAEKFNNDLNTTEQKQISTDPIKIQINKRKIRWQLAAAASIALLFMSFLFWQYFQTPAPQTLAMRYWQETDLAYDSATRGNSVSKTAEQIQIASKLVSTKQYKQALQILIPLYKTQEQAAMLAGKCAFELKNYEQAQTFFSEVLKMPNALSKDKATWCLALTYIYAGNELEYAKQLLQSINGSYPPEAPNKAKILLDALK